MSDLSGSPAAKHLAVDLVAATQHIIISGLQEIFSKLQTQILPQLKTIKEFWVKALKNSIQAGIPLKVS